jgi:hypothetical protein
MLCSRSTGRRRSALTMSAQSVQLNLPGLTSSAAAFHAKTSLAQARARALLEAARASGVSTLALSRNSGLNGSWLRTSRAARLNGSTRSSVSWTHSAMTAYRARCRHAMSELLTCESDSSLLPTLTASQYGSNRGGENPNGPVRASLETMARNGLLPTLTINGNHNRKGLSETSGDGLVTPLKRELLPTLLASHPEGLQDRRGYKHPLMLPTLTRRDEKGPGPANKSRGGKDLPQSLGGHLNPDWCRWFMGFPVGWLDVDDAHVFARSGTRSSRSVPKSSATSSANSPDSPTRPVDDPAEFTPTPPDPCGELVPGDAC